MRFWREILSAAGLGPIAKQLLMGLVLALIFIGMVVYAATGIAGLGISLSLLSLGMFLEILRLVGRTRQKALDQIWPGIFDVLRSGAEAGLTLHEQIEYLANESPLAVRRYFQQLFMDLEHGKSIQEALSRFQNQVGSRSGDFMVMVLLITSELGGRGEAGIWERASQEIRSEQQLMNQVLAKQGWVLGSAKMAVLAPWLIVFVLLSVKSNQEAFASSTGTMILLIGLLLSFFAYFLTSALGRLPIPQRVFDVS